MKQELKAKLVMASRRDPELVCDKADTDKVLGHNPDYLLEVHSITKSDLIRLERLGLALKARYETRHPKADLIDKINAARPEEKPLVCKTGTHRTRWLIFKEALNA